MPVVKGLIPGLYIQVILCKRHVFTQASGKPMGLITNCPVLLAVSGYIGLKIK